YVKFSAGVYLGKYMGGSDGVEVYYLHLNGQASVAADVKTDTKRAVSIRNNVMEANLGASWKSLFFADEPTGLAQKCNVEVTALYTGANGAYFQLTILDDAWVKPCQQPAFTNQDAVAEVAYAFQRQGTQIQYDQTQDRRHINPSPEEATLQDGLVLDCSSYVNAVYYEAFGVNVLPDTYTNNAPKTANYANYAKNNSSNADVVGFWETKNYTTTTAQANLLSSIRSQLQVGDVLNYRRGATSGTSGHAMIYVGNGVWLHCTGGDYQYDSTNPSQSVDSATAMEKSKGAILSDTTDAIFKPGSTSSRFLFYEGGTSTIQNFCILRPLARGLTPTAKTTARMSAKGLDVEKSVSVGEFNAIYVGQEVTYKISVSNTTTSSATNVRVSDVLPKGATLVGATKLAAIGNVLSWTGIIPAGTTVDFTYTVKFTSKTESVVASNLATVNGMTINPIVNTISGYTEVQMQSLATVVKGYASTGKGYTNAVLMVVDAYKTALGRELGYTKVSTPLNEVLDTTNNTCKTDTTAGQMLVPTLYGGLAIKAGYKTDTQRARIVTVTSLAVGDVILASYNSGSSAVAYIYVGDNTLVEINSTEDVCKTVTITTNKYSNILVSLVAYQKYVVLRPSMTA
ncbi:MAG: C40 family peptidase, partial [Clostridia bacterium]|nr:C40 family peptidase [Clostridia bacterium]